MKIDTAPQDNSATYAGHTKLLYGVNEKGEYGTVQSTGWQVENTVTLLAVDEINRITAEIRERVLQGKTSPLEYFMAERRMDVVMLAQTVGMFQWRVRRHFRPEIFRKLNTSLLSRYCDVLGIDEATLRNFPDDKDK